MVPSLLIWKEICGNYDKGYQALKKENEKLKKENQKLKLENQKLKLQKK